MKKRESLKPELSANWGRQQELWEKYTKTDRNHYPLWYSNRLLEKSTTSGDSQDRSMVEVLLRVNRENNWFKKLLEEPGIHAPRMELSDTYPAIRDAMDTVKRIFKRKSPPCSRRKRILE